MMEIYMLKEPIPLAHEVHKNRSEIDHEYKCETRSYKVPKEN